MNEFVFLDSEPLSLASKPDGRTRADDCRAWLRSLEDSGLKIFIPEIMDYEVRRELIRSNATTGLQRLDSLQDQFNFLPLNREAILKAAELWALVRNLGMPTAHPQGLDGDAILAAQALTTIGLDDVAIVATSNDRHLSRFPGIDAREWSAFA